MEYLIKCACNCLRNSTVRGLFATPKLLYLYLSFLCTLSIPVSTHPPYHPMLPFPNGKHINRIHGIWNVLLQCDTPLHPLKTLGLDLHQHLVCADLQSQLPPVHHHFLHLKGNLVSLEEQEILQELKMVRRLRLLRAEWCSAGWNALNSGQGLPEKANSAYFW